MLDTPRHPLGTVIESKSNLGIPNVGGSVERELDRLTIPGYIFQDPEVYGVEWEFICDCAAVTTARSVWVRPGTITTGALAQNVGDASSGDVYNFKGRLTKLVGTRLGGHAFSFQVFGSTFPFGSLAIPPDLVSDYPLMLTASCANAGVVTLQAKRLEALFNS